MKKLLLVITVSGCLMMVNHRASAQCAVCKQSVESDAEDDKLKKRVQGLNKGILYLMAVPYVMGGVAGYMWWKSRKKSGAKEELPF